MQRYTVTSPLGNGNYGTVYKAYDTKSNIHVAMKKYKIEDNSQGIQSTTLREISILHRLRHPNIVELKDVIKRTDDNRMYVVYECMDMDLKKYMDATAGPLDPELICSYTFQMLTALEFCHMKAVMHRDLKPQNLLVNRDGTLKLADFGQARPFVPPVRHFTREVMALAYRPPEILLGSKLYALPIDMWAAGAIIAEMANKCILFYKETQVEVLFKIFQTVGTPTEETWPGCSGLPDWSDSFPKWRQVPMTSVVPDFCSDGVDLIGRLLTPNPKARLSAREALQHPYLEEITQRDRV